MKTLLFFLSALVAIAADTTQYETQSASGSTAAAVTFLPNQINTREVQLVSVDVTSDKAGSLLAFITSTNCFSVYGPGTVSATNGLRFTVYTTNGLFGNVLVWRADTRQSFIATVTNLNGTNVVLNLISNSAALKAGDYVFVLRTNTTPVGAATVRNNGECVFASPRAVIHSFVDGAGYSPLYISLDGTSAVTINAATVRK